MTKFKELLPKIAYFAGAFAVVVGALIFVLATDFVLKLGAAWLFIVMFLTIAACACQVLSDSYRDKRKTAIILKAVALVLCIVLIAFMFIYMGAAFKSDGKGSVDDLFYLKRYTSNNKAFCTMIVTITVVFVALSVAGLTLDLVKTIRAKGDE